MRLDDDYVNDMLVAAEKIAARIAGVRRAGFLADEVLQDAVIRQMQIIGEAARALSGEFRAAHPALPWDDMRGMRNILVHAYHLVSLNIVWDTATRDVPELARLLMPPPDAP